MKIQDISEIVTGLVLAGKLSPEYFTPSELYPPYDLVMKQLKDGKSQTDIIDQIGLSPVISARDAASVFTKDIDPQELIGIVRKASLRETQATDLAKQVTALRRGENLDTIKLAEMIERQNDHLGRYVRMDEVDDSQKTVWRNTYYAPIDEHIGDPEDLNMSGIPEAGLAVVGGPPGTGKTSLFLKIASACARKGKQILIYTLEMTTLQIVRRLLQVSSRGLSTEDRHRIILCEEIMSVNDVYADAMRICATEDIYMVGIDFADLMIEGVEDEQSVAIVYRVCARLAKRNGSSAPVVLLSQLNRNYTGGIPRINHLRYSSLAEAMASLIILVYNPNQIFATQGRDDRLPAYPDRGYLIVGKSRFGYREGGPGAIQTDFNGKLAWGEESYGWTPLTSV